MNILYRYCWIERKIIKLNMTPKIIIRKIIPSEITCVSYFMIMKNKNIIKSLDIIVTIKTNIILKIYTEIIK